ncbi:Utp21 specific WD40 associated putative domain-containing protein [Glomus cerebriforme]|uniref:Utp21 specific WD40 associated putative domain-containing protein n=1 Tax=Glomus cerebriforme TaxID=658196 RepID=A0A397SSB3_9GLOM|nr:Utp21 specific WD40 associated putative domain-containing protein [Glomus cerebriforme]
MFKKIKLEKSKGIQTSKNRPHIFQPFRAIGYFTNDIPFDIQKRGDAYYLTTCVGNSFHVYDCEKLNLITIGSQTDQPITAIASLNENTFVACGKELIVYHRGKEVTRYIGNIRGKIFSLIIFSNYIIALSDDNLLTLWDHVSGEFYDEIKFDERFTLSTIIHPSTYLNKILIGSRQGIMQIWNIRTKKMKYSFPSFGFPITFLTQSPVVDVIAIGLLNGTIILYNIKMDESIMSLKQEGCVTSISFRTDDKHIMASANTHGDITQWDLDKKKLYNVIKGAHDGLIPSIQFLNGQAILITSGADNAIKVWIFEGRDGFEHRILKSRSGHHSPPTKIKYYGSSGHFILSAAGDKSFRLFSVIRDSQSVELSQGSIIKQSKRSRKHIDELKFPQITHFSSSESRQKEWDNILTCHLNDSRARTWSFQRKALGQYVFKTLDGTSIKATNISACGNFGFIGTSTGVIEMFNMQSGFHRKTFAGNDGHFKSISGLASDPLNRVLISSSLDGTIKIWDFNTAKVLHTIKIMSPIAAMIYHCNNDLLAINSDDLCIRVIDIETRKIVREFWGHRNRITDLTFSPDGRWIVSASLDATIRTWDLPTGHLIDIFRVDDIATSITFSPTGDFLATSHVNNVGIFLWANRSQFCNMSLRSIDEEEIVSTVSLPTTIGLESDNEDDLDEVDNSKKDEKSFETVEQLTEQMITLSLLPKSKWQNLLNLETIKKRNKPKEPPKTNEKAPFFLPTLPGVEPKFVPLNDESKDKKKKSKNIIKMADIKIETEFLKILKKNHEGGDYTEFFDFIKTLNPSAIDFELRSLSLENDLIELKYFLDAIEFKLKTKKDFELVQAYLNHFLKIYGDIIMSNKDDQQLYNHLISILNEHKKEWKRIEELLQYNLCVLGFFRK